MRNFTDKKLNKIAKKLSFKIALTATRYEYIDFCIHYTTLPDKTQSILNKELADKNFTIDDELLFREILIKHTHPKCMVFSALNAIWWNIFIPALSIAAIALIFKFLI